MKGEREKPKTGIELRAATKSFMENQIERAKREENISRVELILKDMPRVPRGTASKLVRESRDRDH